MKPNPDPRTEAALYWSAVSLIVCEGLSIDKAAERLGVPQDDVRDVLHHRQALSHYNPSRYSPPRPM
jgi:DNA-directed RNA polymerase specialized sigma24 family protein